MPKVKSRLPPIRSSHQVPSEKTFPIPTCACIGGMIGVFDSDQDAMPRTGQSRAVALAQNHRLFTSDVKIYLSICRLEHNYGGCHDSVHVNIS